ncbi:MULTISPECIES: hypothetical protein [unclassified Romboutsia]|uniref:hypothetical protein n=1 Tax=unclassified Romboutsia TaxID=2626894 RepID=UPI000822D15E|nr:MULTISPECIES: hypothetical protein [unclassified Romboutsia]SCG94742.1 Uncharacterised protein [uncultured Clostridium sp.]
MSFIDKTEILIESSKGELNLFTFDDNIIYTSIDLSSSKEQSHTILDGEFSFIDICLDITHDDTIYGIINNKAGKLLKLNISNGIINTDSILKYDFINFMIKFVYIKYVFNDNHIFYYSINKKHPYSAYLIHIYNSDKLSKKSRIDIINYDIMTNFIVIFNKDIPSIFYFKLVNGFEELFVSTFDFNLLKWSFPVQITNSKKSKIYLSALIDDSGIYHITFSEKNSGKYFCTYLKGQLKYRSFKIYNQQLLSKDPMCAFPSIFKYKSKLYIKWIEYFNLYECISYDSGNTWTTPNVDLVSSNDPFLRYQYHSNSKHFNGSDVFGLKDGSIIL